MKFTAIPIPYQEARQRLIEKTLSIFEANDALRENAISIVELVDWYHYEVGYDRESDVLGIYVVVLSELVRLAGFEWVEFECRGGAFPMVRHVKNGFVVSRLDEVVNLVGESPKSEMTFSRIFFSCIVDLYTYAPISGPGWHPILDVSEYGRTDLVVAEDILAAANAVNDMDYKDVVSMVYELGFRVWKTEGKRPVGCLVDE